MADRFFTVVYAAIVLVMLAVMALVSVVGLVSGQPAPGWGVVAFTHAAAAVPAALALNTARKANHG